MASHLTVTTATPTGVASKALNGQQQSGAESGGLMGLFAALLGGAGGTAKAAATGESGFDFNLGNLVHLGLEAGFGQEQGEGATDPEALAAALDGAVPYTLPVEPQKLVAFIDALGALKAGLDAGEPLDLDRLAEVEEALAGLAEALGLDLSELDVPEDLAALLAGIDAEAGDPAALFAALLTPLAQSLAAAPPAAEADAEAIVQSQLAADRLAALGNRLAALLAALEAGDVAAEKLAALGMAGGADLDPGIEAALARFAAAATADAVPEEPQLAPPVLKVTEPVLTGKPAEAAQPAQSAAATPAAAASDEAGADAGDGGRDAAPRERAAEPPAREPRSAQAAPAATDASATPAPSQAGQAAQAARIDAAANPRIIQAGYQTSQQQFNLPQIAFELARQVNDGNTRFQIRLDPPELGRIDVRLDIDTAGKVNARLTVEKAETLDLMQRDQRGLERALQQAGLDGSKTNLEFSLKQNPFAGQQHQQGQDGEAGRFGLDGAAAEQAEETPPTVNLYRGALVASGVNIIA